MIINGNGQILDYANIDISFVPCNVLVGPEEISDDCIADLEKQIEYLGPISLMTFANFERFDDFKFDNQAITRESKFTKVQINVNRPNYVLS